MPVTFARTRVIPYLLDSRERAGKLLGVRRTMAVLQLEELIYAGRDERVAYSRDLFAPGGIDVMVMRSLESTRPAPIVNLRNSRGNRARRGQSQAAHASPRGRELTRAASRRQRTPSPGPDTMSD